MLQSSTWLDVDPAIRPPLAAVATLGPPGTSSEIAAAHFWRSTEAGDPPCVLLHDTYESAAAALHTGRASHLVVANAYSGINAFYMDPRLALTAAFLLDTPPYGLAAPDGGAVPRRVSVSTHPAPALLVGELMPDTYTLTDLVFTTSTSVAAAKASTSETDLALTTLPAALAHHLTFISRTRPIRMLWSAFVRRPDTPGAA